MQNNLRSGLRSFPHKHSLSFTSTFDLRARILSQTCTLSSGKSGLATFLPTRPGVSFTPSTSSSLSEEKDDHPVRMLMFGKPGAGKGTLTARLAHKYDILTLSTGDLLRQHIADGTDVGKEAEDIISRGGLVPDEVVLKVITTKLDALQTKHWILDGFPRTIRQGQLLDQHLAKRNTPLTLVVNIDVPDDVILSRISERWIHLPSGRVYNMSYNRPCIEGFDDLTGEPLTRRPDDNLQVFARRLESFYSTTSPLLNYYSERAASSKASSPSYQHPHQVSFHRPAVLKVKTFKGTTSDELWPQLDRLLQNSFPGLRERQGPRVTKLRRLVGNRDKSLNSRTDSIKV